MLCDYPLLCQKRRASRERGSQGREDGEGHACRKHRLSCAASWRNSLGAHGEGCGGACRASRKPPHEASNTRRSNTPRPTAPHHKAAVFDLAQPRSAFTSQICTRPTLCFLPPTFSRLCFGTSDVDLLDLPETLLSASIGPSAW